jgi:hypothetical protein
MMYLEMARDAAHGGGGWGFLLEHWIRVDVNPLPKGLATDARIQIFSGLHFLGTLP